MVDVESGGTPILDSERRVTREAPVGYVVLVAKDAGETGGDVAAAELALAIGTPGAGEVPVHASHLRLLAPLYGVDPRVVNG